jgi:hypothetical protein
MWLGQDDSMQGLGCPGGCHGTDGNLYQWVQGVDGLGASVGYWRRMHSLTPNAAYARNSAPFLGQIAEGGDGNLYQWVQSVDGLGNPVGFWKRLKRRVKRFAQRALPIARQFAPFFPGGAAALTAATPFLRQAGLGGPDGLGALYEAPDGSMYQVQGIDAGDDLDGLEADDELSGLSEDELQGLAADEELSGFGADDELNGFAADDELSGFGAEDALDGIDAGDELEGFAADEDLSGFADDDLQGIDDDEGGVNGYVRDAGMSGMDGFIPDLPRQTPAFNPSPNAPMWAPIW